MKFAADRTVGRLAQWLRLMGYDTVDSDSLSPESVISLADENRIMLTRDTHLSQRIKSLKIVCLASNDPKDQAREVIKALRLQPHEKYFFTRCKLCNTILKRVSSEEVVNQVPDHVLEKHNRFSKCPTCKRVYWPGTHHERIQKTLRDLC
ncbi:MAG: Mut7-C RNAse domain-containing protein [Deltaproteobacteria bacterium]|nr:Mut7-C RNAse domain-containing protein [Deltaproteobacteria bacterium]